MKIVEPKIYAIDKEEPEDQLKWLERLARVPYKSEGNITEDSYDPFLKKIIGSGHTAMVEFEKITFIIQCDRGVTHELVRHRMASFAQESTRYCNYFKERQGGQVTFIRPFFYANPADGESSYRYSLWLSAMRQAEKAYFDLLEAGSSPQQARSVLPNSTKSIIVVQMNFRELLHFFELRCDPKAHPQMRQIAIPMYRYCKEKYPTIFSDLVIKETPESLVYDKDLLEPYLAELIKVHQPSDLPEDI